MCALIRAPQNGHTNLLIYFWIIFKIKEPRTQLTVLIVYWGVYIYITFLQMSLKMLAHFVSRVFLYLSKTPFSIFTSQKSSWIFSESICGPLSNRLWIGKINSDIYWFIFLTITSQFRKISTKYHNFRIWNNI